MYVYYTATTPTVHNRISRFTANGDVAVAGSEVVILELDNLSSATNHNGGALAFGADGKLYAAVGENANGANAQSLANLLGKMLRINTDGTHPDRQSVLHDGDRAEPRHLGARPAQSRSPSRSTPPAPTMFINDVGQNTWEEINDGRAGANYGWPETEGATTDPRFVGPRYAYNHAGGGVRDHRRRVLRAADGAVPVRVLRATISSPTTAAAGFGGSIVARQRRHDLRHRHLRRRSI